jgi:hypothetical protein
MFPQYKSVKPEALYKRAKKMLAILEAFVEPPAEDADERPDPSLDDIIKSLAGSIQRLARRARAHPEQRKKISSLYHRMFLCELLGEPLED